VHYTAQGLIGLSSVLIRLSRLFIIMAGSLYIIATPIGNLEDITLRALRVLKEVDLIACEDTRHTRKLLVHYQISKPTVSYHEHNERERTAELIDKIEAGLNVALVSDAGTPLISDPGFLIVNEAIDRQIPVIPIPGPSALVTALSAAGLPTGEFAFIGFLPSQAAARRARLKELADVRSTLIFYEAPHRIKATIEDARKALGDRECVIARELTKLHEEFVRGRLSEIALPEGSARGEIVLLVGPPREGPAKQTEGEATRSIVEEVEQMMEAEGLDQKNALKRVARERGIGKSEAYRLMIAERARNK
jgi:16S rRNA (cytidine1402-2'-O)-methyltransferase